MSADRRGDFIEWARRARSKPTFDLEERDHRLAVADRVWALIDAARGDRPLRDEVLALVECAQGTEFPLLARGHLLQIVEWADADARGLACALRDFAAEDDPAARLARFAAAVDAGPLAGRVAGGGLAVASLLNFGLAPETVPLAHPARYGQLQELLGETRVERRSARETYRACLDFAFEIDRLLRAGGVPVRDMVDVDSLISICVVEQELWAGAGMESGSKRASRPSTYLAMGALIRNPGRYIAEWLEFHRLVGVERFFLYDNESDDNTREILAPYEEDGSVVVHDWPGSASHSYFALLALQCEAYTDCIRTHREDARWIAVIDTDEFLFSPLGRPLPELLVEFERWPALAVGCVAFGTSGHVTPPPGLVIESYTQRLATDGTIRPDHRIKNIVDPIAVTHCESPHKFAYAQGAAVDENGYPVLKDMTKSRSIDRIRINHYFARSEREVRAKHPRRLTSFTVDPGTAPDRWRLESDVEDFVRRTSAPGARDEAILRYAPAVREALAERAVVK